MSLSWGDVALILVGFFELARLAVGWHDRWCASQAVLTVTSHEAAARALSAREQATLRAVAARPGAAHLTTGVQETADRLRAAFPDIPDGELGRAMLHARWLVLHEHHRGRNCVQIGQVLGLVAVDLTSLDREVTTQ
jgi:hypothetical protein